MHSPRLRPSEWRVLTRLARGESNAAIAAALGLTPGTVAHHLQRVYWALGFQDLRDKRHRAARWYRAPRGASRGSVSG